MHANLNDTPNPIPTAQKTILQGQPLQDFLDSLREIWWEPLEWAEDEAQEDDPQPHPSSIALEDRRADLVARVRTYHFVPHTPEQLERLHFLLQDLGLKHEALQLLLDNRNRDGFFSVIDSIPLELEFERAVWAIRLEYCQVDCLYQLNAQEKCHRHMQRVASSIAALPEPKNRTKAHEVYQLWGRLESWGLTCQHQALFSQAARQSAEVFHRHQLHQAILPKETAISMAHARYAHRWLDPTTTAQHIAQAIGHAECEAGVADGQWMNLCAAVLDLNPAQVPTVLEARAAYLRRTEQPPAAPAIWAERRTLAARQQARAFAAQGQLEAAIIWAKRGHFALDHDANYDVFGREVLDWLVQAGRMSEAAELALYSLFHNRRPVREHAFDLAWEQSTTDQNPQRHILWTLALLWARQIPELVNQAKDTGRDLKSVESYLRRLEKADATHPAFCITRDYFRGMYASCLMDINRQKKTWPQLEASVLGAPTFASKDIVLTLWCSRFMTCNEQDIRKLPIPESHGGRWCFGIAWQLQQPEYRYCPQRYWQPHARLRKELAQHYYEMGLARFERFFESAENADTDASACAYLDADREFYALLCNNLGNIYRHQKQFQKAIAIYQKSLAAWPCAQATSNLMRCFHELKDWASEANAAETHWQVVQQHGYQGADNYYNPARYAQQIAHALHQSGRGADIAIWLERLNHWWQQRENEKEAIRKKTCRGDYLNALAALLSFYAIAHAAQAEPLLREHLAEIEGLNKKHAGEKSHGSCQRHAAETLLHCAQASGDTQTRYQAAHFFRRALSCLGSDEREETGFARKGLAECAV